MYRALALLALPLLVAGCGSASKSAHSEAPPPTIDSFRDSYLSGKPLPAPPPQQPEVASMPVPQIDQPQADQVGGDQAGGDQSGDAGGSASDQTATAPSKPAAPPPYKASIAAYIKRYAVDSSSLKLAKIGTPFQGSVNGQKGSIVCVELGMSGSRTAYLLKDNSVADSELGAAACHDKKLQPWTNAGA